MWERVECGLRSWCRPGYGREWSVVRSWSRPGCGREWGVVRSWSRPGCRREWSVGCGHGGVQGVRECGVW